MAQEGKVIVTCAITGAIHTPSMSPYLPVTPEEIAQAAIEAVDAGAAIVHLHARDPETGKPDQRPEAFLPILQLVKKRSDCIVNLTTGGAPYMKVEERVRPAALFKRELASLNMGSMNFGLFLLHVLPEGFQRIRYYGFLANRYREQKLTRCRDLLGMPAAESATSKANKDYRDRYEELAGSSLWKCPVCHQGRMLTIGILPRSPHRLLTPIKDTS